MSAVASALARALPVLASARIVAVVLLPLAGAALAFGLFAWWAWTPLVDAIAVRAFGAARDASGAPEGFAAAAAVVTAFATLVALALVAALVAIAVLAMPVIVKTVAARDFPALERRRGGTFAGSVRNALVAVAAFVPLWLASLVLIAVPPLFVPVTLVLSAWLNQRLLRYDALAEHADAREMADVVRTKRGALFALGLVLAPLAYVPVVNLVAPLYAGIAFTYLCLGALAAKRGVAGAPIPART